MRRLIFLIFVHVVIFLLLQCGEKGEDRIEEGVFQPGEFTVEVEIPQVVWEKSIAVVPTEKVGISDRQDAISKVVYQEIVSHLSKSSRLQVVPAPSEDWLEKSGLEVDYLLTSREESREAGTRYFLHLVDAQKDSSLVEDSFDEDVELIFTATEQAAGNVMQKLDQTIPVKETGAREKISADIMRIYLEAKSDLAKGTRTDIDTAIGKFKNILRTDSTFVLGYVGLSESYIEIVNTLGDRKPVWLKLAQDASQRALELDPSCSEAYVQLGEVYLGWGDFKQAEESFRNGLIYNSSAEEAWAGLGNVFTYFGLYEPCLKVYDQALSLNPANADVSLSRAMILMGLKQYHQAEEDIRRIIRFRPDDLYYHSFLALSRYYQDDLNGAFKEVREGIQAELYRPFSHAVLGMIYAKEGKLDEALGEVELEVKPYVENNGSLASAVAAIYALLKQNGQAVQWLEKAVDWGYKEYSWLINDPNFEGLRDDPRFRNLMARVKQDWEENIRQYSLERYPT